MPGEIMDFMLMADKSEAVAETSPEAAPLARLIVRAQSGDHRAFDQLLIQHQHRVISLAWRLLGNQDDARDAAQESFLRVFKHLNKFDPAQDFSGWLYRIVVNVCRDLARRRRHGSQISLEAEFESGHLKEPAGPQNTEAAAMHSQEQAIIARALTTLTEKERAAIVLRDLEGLPTEEVARILGSRPTTVRSQISSARVKIRAFKKSLEKSRKV
ncbi:MAG TPA: RNA polymerase sigma factor [Blastocatellia bacterium]|nr:RNA polymerase sigma factor [Blastocatellia bacterium]